MVKGAGNRASEKRAVRAAGCVVWRSTAGDDVEVLVIHRDRYDDWSFPKGKLDAGETEREAALREVREETNVEGELGDELALVSYTDHKGRPKTVRYWLLEYVSGRFEPNDEVDAIAWLDVEAARARLSYQHDVDLLTELLHRREQLVHRREKR